MRYHLDLGRQFCSVLDESGHAVFTGSWKQCEQWLDQHENLAAASSTAANPQPTRTPPRRGWAISNLLRSVKS
ncbi:hypothetical protein [Thalassoroseus pseudoceratinae]|uniref:hypothetical protein n=1 Tax=Thalassoroseus pseudoceratinae TaxID=2713176 RepID=UPI00141DCE69|nr:hypothetical protein [Thalassoroseus pseudoceratinae]